MADLPSVESVAVELDLAYRLNVEWDDRSGLKTESFPSAFNL